MKGKSNKNRISEARTNLQQQKQKILFCFRELFHPCHQKDPTTFLAPVVIVQQVHSKEGSQLRYRGHDHPSVEINTCTIDDNKINLKAFIPDLLRNLMQLFVHWITNRWESLDQVMKFDMEEHLHRRLRGDTSHFLLFIYPSAQTNRRLENERERENDRESSDVASCFDH